MSEQFPKTARLLRSVDFVTTKARGKRRGGTFVLIWASRNTFQHARLGLAVSRKVGKSHDRNLLKRRTREIFRRAQSPFMAGFDYVVVFKPGATTLDFLGLHDELARLLKP